jgi:ABC-2 type transport system permease protein
MSSLSLAAPEVAATPRRARARGRGRGVRSALRAERRKLAAQLPIRLVALAALAGPFAFAGILKLQGGAPSDTLYGAWVHGSGYALSLVVLGFAGSWGLPVLVGVIAGDVCSSEDRHGTWKLVLTRSRSRGELFAGKAIAAGVCCAALIALAGASSLLAGLMLVGGGPLVSLSGTVLGSGHLLWLVALSWLSCLLPALAFASLGLLLSVATRNGILGVLGPALAALAMQLLLLGGSGVWAHTLLVASAFTGWHGLLAGHPFLGPLLAGQLVSLAWIAGCLSLAWRILRRRDFAGTPVARRTGWRAAAPMAAGLIGALAVLALAGNLGPAGITAARLKGSLVPAFERLAVLQQRELGRPVAAGARLHVVLPSCTRRGGSARGPGDWACTINVLIPTGGTIPPQPTPVTYDLSVQSDGCYKADSPPAFVGAATIATPSGGRAVNPLYTIYGCFDVF